MIRHLSTLCGLKIPLSPLRDPSGNKKKNSYVSFLKGICVGTWVCVHDTSSSICSVPNFGRINNWICADRWPVLSQINFLRFFFSFLIGLRSTQNTSRQAAEEMLIKSPPHTHTQKTPRNALCLTAQAAQNTLRRVCETDDLAATEAAALVQFDDDTSGLPPPPRRHGGLASGARR